MTGMRFMPKGFCGRRRAPDEVTRDGWKEQALLAVAIDEDRLPICLQFGISRATANRRWQDGLAIIVWRLNGKRVPGERSMGFVVAKAGA